MMKNTILIRCSGYIDVVPLHEIIRIEAYQNYAKVFKQSGKMLLSSDCLKQLLNLIVDNNPFFQCHKSHVVNLDFVTQYNYKDGNIELNGEVTIPVSRRKKNAFTKTLQSHYRATISS